MGETGVERDQPGRSPDYAVDVVLRDGSTIRLRPLVEEDGARVAEFYGGLSDQSLFFRFLQARTPAQAVETSLRTDFPRTLTLVAERGDALLGIASWARESDDAPRAEVAFAVAEAFHGHGLGTRMLERLAELARPLGVTVFEAWVHAANHEMQAVFQHSGFTVAHADMEAAVSHLVLDLGETGAYLDRAAARATHAATASLRPFFAPRVVAVVGASRVPGKIGAEIFRAIRAGGFTGTVIPVNTRAEAVDGIPAVPRLSAIDGAVDLAVIAVPCDQVETVVDDCVAKRIKAVVVVSAGFAETGEEGRRREARLVERIRAAGIRLIGPNCMGLIETDPAVSLNASFAPSMPPAGRVAFLSQSGALGLAILEHARRLGVGISTFVSVGNKADVSGNDLLQYWADDARTDVILLYLESFGNPRKFARIARRVARSKPIVAVKAGRSGAGARAASSHTGAMASDDRVVDALFEQAGVIRTSTLEEMFDVATLLAHQPLPSGPRVAVLTNAGGPGILAADACEVDGLQVVRLDEASTRALRAAVPHAASVANPVDLLASASPDDYRRALDLLLADASVDAVMVLYIAVLTDRAAEVAQAVTAAARHANGKPILATFLDAKGAPASLGPIPSFAFPEGAARALARVERYARWRRRPLGRPVVFADFQERAARAAVARAVERGGGWLPPDDLRELFDAVGLPLLTARMARSEAEACAAAREAGFPVAVKAAGPTIVHKTEIGGVKLGLQDEAQVAEAWRDLAGRLGAALDGVVVQPMAPEGPEMLVGAVQHPIFGPLVACGAGGTLAEILQDTVYRLTPLATRDAEDMIDALKCAPLLRGFRGQPASDVPALRDALLRLSLLLEACPAIQEVDLNPVRVLTEGLVLLDARVRVEQVAPPVSRRIWY